MMLMLRPNSKRGPAAGPKDTSNGVLSLSDPSVAETYYV
jgi:hypothetical protein